MTAYGYIGLGQMGAAMCSHLLGLNLPATVYDLDTQRVEEAVAKGASAAASPAEVAANSEIVSVCVPAAAHLEAVLHGDDGLRDAGTDDLTILVHSTLLPEQVQAARSRAAGWGADLHDACVAGGAAAAATGDLTILAGGLEDMTTHARDLLHHYGSKVVDAGAVGSACALKLGINVMTYAQFAAATTAFEIVTNDGVATDTLVDVWRHLGQLGKLTEAFLILAAIPAHEMPDAVREIVTSSVAIAQKDLELASELTETENLNNVIDALHDAMGDTFGLA